MAEISIAGRLISDDMPCFMVAELGHNHQGNIRTCKQMIEAAKNCGVDAVKLQKRNIKSLYTSSFYNTAYNAEGAFGPTYGLHREALEFGYDEYRELQQ